MHFDEFEAVLLDLDGTIYREDHVLPGAVELVKNLHAQGKKFACLSNSTFSPAHVNQRLRHMGIDIETEQIYTAAAAAVDYVMDRRSCRVRTADHEHLSGPQCGPYTTSLPRIFNLATEGVQEMLEERVRWVESADEPCEAVIVGTPTNVYATEDRQRTALMLLRRGATLVGICADRVFPSPRGLEFGSGALSSMLAYAANVQPVFTGKPQETFFRKLCEHLAVRPAGCLLIGDNLESDIAGGKALGMRTMLTLTGVASRDDLPSASASARPDFIIPDLTNLL